ncbi:MAG: DUF829 domain-containing protein [Bdellovibrionales bacterium]|nr:DUF829 domain-containing protein [Bdellovibrionales bacterium]
MTIENFPSQTIIPSHKKKHDTKIIFIHHLGGEPVHLKHHVEFLNQNGFDVYTYPAFLHGKEDWDAFFPLIKKSKKGILEIWTEELEQQLNQLNGKKIIFSFSFPSVSALLAISKRTDIKALICDGGPFLDLWSSCWRFFTYHQQIKSVLFKLYLTGRMYFAFQALSIRRKIKKQLMHIPKNFPILSLQSEQDQLVPASSINKFFKQMKQVHLTTVPLKDSAHLEGLKKERDFYMKSVLTFLQKVTK